MLSLAALITFAFATAIASVVPGPTVAVIVASSVRHGTRAGVLTALGTQLAVVAMLGVIALGLEAVVGFMGWAFEWIKLAGAAYLIYLGWRLFTAKQEVESEPAARPTVRRSFVLNGFLVVWSNPKTLLFLGAFLPHFIVADAPALPQLAVLGGITLAIASANDFGYAVAAGGLRTIMTEARARFAARLSGLALMVGGVWLAFSKRA